MSRVTNNIELFNLVNDNKLTKEELENSFSLKLEGADLRDYDILKNKIYLYLEPGVSYHGYVRPYIKSEDGSYIVDSLEGYPFLYVNNLDVSEYYLNNILSLISLACLKYSGDDNYVYSDIDEFEIQLHFTKAKNL
jgi:hypothetical protein